MLGLRLDADAVRPLHVAADQSPDDADHEDQAHQIAEGDVGAVDVAMEELERLGHLVIDLEHGRDPEQAEEPEVDHRVHEPGAGVAEQRLHVDAGAEVLESLLAFFAVVLRWAGAPRSQFFIRFENMTAAQTSSTGMTV